jgi:hypothetical protein
MDQQEFQSHVIDTLARLDTKMESLVGNGQPGRVSKLESAVDELKKAKWTLGGLVVGISTTVSALIHFVFRY